MPLFLLAQFQTTVLLFEVRCGLQIGWLNADG
jgi:hypothetical protein